MANHCIPKKGKDRIKKTVQKGKCAWDISKQSEPFFLFGAEGKSYGIKYSFRKTFNQKVEYNVRTEYQMKIKIKGIKRPTGPFSLVLILWEKGPTCWRVKRRIGCQLAGN